MGGAEMIKDHEIAKLVNDLRDVAVQFHGAQQLRARIQEVLLPFIETTKPKRVCKVCKGSGSYKVTNWRTTTLESRDCHGCMPVDQIGRRRG